MEEVWKDIPGYEGSYQVSNLGRVKSLPRVVQIPGYGTRTLSEKMLRLSRCTSGHLYVNLRKDGSTHHSEIHRLVMLAFVGPCPPGMEVCHNDSNPKNNRLDNLRYDTHMNNMIDMSYVGNRSRQKLSVEDVLVVRERLKRGEVGRRLAEEYGVTPAAISAINRGRNWTWLK